MNIIDDANIFAAAVKKCPEVIQLKEANKKISENDIAKKMLQEFRVVQVEAYSEKMQKGDVSQATKDKFERFSSFMRDNPDFANYLIAEQKFGLLWEDVMKIINDAIGLDPSFKDNK